VIPEGQVHAYADVKNIQINNILFDASSLPLYFYDMELCPGQELFIKSEVDSGQGQALPRIQLDLQQLTKMMNIVDRLESILEERRPGFRLYAISSFYQLMIMLLEAYRGISEKELLIPEQHYFRTTPVLFLNRIRIEHASRLLLSSDLNINEIAALTGFSDNSYFSRRFKAATGLAPREFRDFSRRW
jgi:AraC-like DNA-binding protein